MRHLIIVMVFSVACSLIKAQKVENITAEQAGDFIKISYKLTDSKPGEFYRIRALCSINNGPNIELRSVSGDVGENVQGGKYEYLILWDVLKDVEELKSAEFIIRAEKVRDMLRNAPGIKQKRGSFMPVFQLPGTGFGGRLSFMGKAGFTFQYVNAKTSYTGEYSDREATRLHRVSFGPTFRIVNSGDDQMHLFVGPAIGQNWIVEENPPPSVTPYDFNLHFSPGFEAGIILTQKNTLLMISAQKLLPDLTEEGEAITRTMFLTAGIGIRF